MSARASRYAASPVPPKLHSCGAMLAAAATTAAFPPAVYSFPVKRTRRLSCSCRAGRISAGYSQLELRRVSYRPPGNEQNLLNQIILSLREKRYFLADTVLEEVTFGWPRQKADYLLREQLALNLVGLNTISLDEDPQSLCSGFKQQLALAIHLVQTADLLLFDKPLVS